MKTVCRLSVMILLAGFVYLSGGLLALGYDEIWVGNGGRITGMARFNGPIPPPRIFPAVLYPFGTFCEKNEAISDGGGNITIREFDVGPNGGLADVVIAVQGVDKGKRFEPIIVKLVSRGCEFLPLVSVVKNNGMFTMVNEDPVIHNSQLYQAEKGNVILNVPILPNSTRDFPIHFQKRRRIYQMICGMHEFMQTWGYAVENPYYAKTKTDGQFAIDDIPPGTYKVTAWYPHYDVIEKEITVAAGKSISLDFIFESSEVERPGYESQQEFRIGPRGDKE